MHIPFLSTSLRRKLIALLTTMLFLTAVPLIGSSLRQSSEALHQTYEDAIQDILLLAEYNVRHNFKDRSALTALIKDAQKSALEEASLALAPLVREIMLANPDKPLLSSSSLKGSVADIHLVRLSGSAVASASPEHLHALMAGWKDRDGNALPSILAGARSDLPGFFVTLHKPGEDSILVYVLPLQDTDMAILAETSLTQMQEQIRRDLERLREELQHAFHNLAFLEDGFVVAYDADTLEIVAQSNDREIPFSGQTILEASVHNKKPGLTRTEQGDYLCAYANLKQPDILLVAAIPQDEIAVVIENLAWHQGTVFAAVLLLGIGLAALFARHMLAPLGHLTQLAKQFSAQDFTRPQSDLQRELPLDREDEIGELARSFSEMNDLLHSNIANLLRVTSTKERLERELTLAAELQRGILPPPLEVGDAPFILDATLIPAREIGGDLYDFFPVDEETLCVCLGDVSDKGMASALFMSVVVTLIHSIVKPGTAPEEVLGRVNDELNRHNPQNMFVTLFLGLYNTRTGELRFASGGHPAPLFLTPSGGSRYLTEQPVNLVLGLMPHRTYTGGMIRLGKGEGLLLYTDGVTEAADAEGLFMGSEHLQSLAASLYGQECRTVRERARDVIDGVIEGVQLFVGKAEQRDDMSLLLLCRSDR